MYSNLLTYPSNLSNFFFSNYSKSSHTPVLYNRINSFTEAVTQKVNWPEWDSQSMIGLPRKLVRSSFTNSFTTNLASNKPVIIKSQTILTTNVSSLNSAISPNLTSALNNSWSRSPTLQNQSIVSRKRRVATDFKLQVYQKSALNQLNRLNFLASLKTKSNDLNSALSPMSYNNDRSNYNASLRNSNRLNVLINAQYKGVLNPQLLKAQWIMDELISQAKGGSIIQARVKATPKNLALKRGIFFILRQVQRLMVIMKDDCAIKGVQITISGRISNKKKARKQKFTRSIGQVPLSSLNEHIDYTQQSLKNRFGSVGVKVWVCYKQDFNFLRPKSKAYN